MLCVVSVVFLRFNYGVMIFCFLLNFSVRYFKSVFAGGYLSGLVKSLGL